MVGRSIARFSMLAVAQQLTQLAGRGAVGKLRCTIRGEREAQERGLQVLEALAGAVARILGAAHTSRGGRRRAVQAIGFTVACELPM